MTTDTRQKPATRQAHIITPRYALTAQAATAIVLMLAAATFGRQAALSVLFAGVLCIIANGIAVRLMFCETKPQAAKKILLNFCTAEIVKLILVTGGIAAAALGHAVNPVISLGAYAVLQFSLLPAICLLAGAVSVFPRFTSRQSDADDGYVS